MTGPFRRFRPWPGLSRLHAWGSTFPRVRDPSGLRPCAHLPCPFTLSPGLSSCFPSAEPLQGGDQLATWCCFSGWGGVTPRDDPALSLYLPTTARRLPTLPRAKPAGPASASLPASRSPRKHPLGCVACALGDGGRAAAVLDRPVRSKSQCCMFGTVVSLSGMSDITQASASSCPAVPLLMCHVVSGVSDAVFSSQPSRATLGTAPCPSPPCGQAGGACGCMWQGAGHVCAPPSLGFAPAQ